MNRNDLNPVVRDDVALAVAIGVLETSSVARGIEVADAVLKEAQVELLFATPVQPGKYVLLFTGAVLDVRSSARRGAELAGADLVDQLVIPQVHEQVVPMLRRKGGRISARCCGARSIVCDRSQKQRPRQRKWCGYRRCDQRRRHHIDQLSRHCGRQKIEGHFF